MFSLDWVQISRNLLGISQNVAELLKISEFLGFSEIYNLFKLCFNDCVRNFSASALTEEEQECGRKCVGKYLEYSARVAQQFMKRNSQQ